MKKFLTILLIAALSLTAFAVIAEEINYVTVENGAAEIDVAFLQGFTYQGKAYGAPFFKEHSAAVLYNLLNAAANDKEDLRERLAAEGIRFGAYDKVYFLIRRLARTALKIKVGKAGRIVNFFTFGKGVDRKAVKAHKNDRLLPYIIDIFLCLFDGSSIAQDMPETVKTIALDVSSLPRRVISKLPMKKAKKEKIYRTTNQIEALMEELVHPSAPDNLHVSVRL